ncbi:MAG: hypothetical protein ACI9KE_004794 [Polyangiales bacterium]|jgi:hypothetical protein
MLAFSPTLPAYVGIDEVRDACTAASLSDFAPSKGAPVATLSGDLKTLFCMRSWVSTGRDSALKEARRRCWRRLHNNAESTW